MPCPFCLVPADRITQDGEHAIVIRDGFPVSPGHTLIIPKRHVASFFEITDAERADLMSLLAAARDDLERSFIPRATTSASTMAPPPARRCRTCTST